MLQNITAKTKNQKASRPFLYFIIGLVAWSTGFFAIISIGYTVEWLGIDMQGELRQILSGTVGRALGLFLVGTSTVLMISIAAIISVVAFLYQARIRKQGRNR